MLNNELLGIKYNKAEHRRNLLPLLNNRSESSIEFKHQNISAVLVNLGQLYIKGYLPRFNYQALLEEIVIKYLENNQWINKEFQGFVDRDIKKLINSVEFENLIQKAPELGEVQESRVTYRRRAVKVNYLEKEQQNRSLGELGEQFVFEYEKWNLLKQGKHSLSDSVEWIARDQGDGAGFDILSKNLNGTDKYIEVKTTRLGKETPFYFSSNEFNFSIEHVKNFYLYRLYNFEDKVGMFTKNGSFKDICNYKATNYRGYF
ncbi:DUF3883 domain-containing protein [Marinifilum sp. N1E240]|uniref:DUF3883 domain-containing protein n=1 Tax=Marinifilum sp. N1E240 TaxID=2608082 RepID=UPI00186B7CCB|nr:DUF3883 domain-containing protein [Marinifilum sp. N1E240]